jgi:hypothetical protein
VQANPFDPGADDLSFLASDLPGSNATFILSPSPVDEIRCVAATSARDYRLSFREMVKCGATNKAKAGPGRQAVKKME